MLDQVFELEKLLLQVAFGSVSRWVFRTYIVSLIHFSVAKTPQYVSGCEWGQFFLKWTMDILTGIEG